MISPFEATLLGLLQAKPESRYDVMKAIQNQSLYWTGSPGAVYSALARLEEKGMVEKLQSYNPAIFSPTPLGLKAFQHFSKIPVPARKLIVEPALLRLKLRSMVALQPAERIDFYQKQLKELIDARGIVETKRGLSDTAINQDLSDLAIAQLTLEVELVQKLLAQELGA